MRIVDHKLEGAWRGHSPNSGGKLSAPSLLVMHYTVSGGTGPEGVTDYFLSPKAKASAHLIVGRNGKIDQVVPFDVRAWHAGTSVWRGKPNCNDYSIGIEVDNWGRLARAEDGSFRSAADKVVPADRVTKLRHKHDSVDAYWEIYPEKQLAALVDATRAILDAYPSIREIVGHDDIAPIRKSDPGPAFPMSRFTGLVEGRAGGPVTRTVIASSLNARGGPGVEYDVLGTFAKGTKLAVLYDEPGLWAQVRGKLSNGNEVTAWAADQFMA